MRVHEAVAEGLTDGGVDTVFGLMGDANMLYVANFRDRGGRFVAAAHEGSAVGMADAWARATGRVGVASVTHGPAFTNTLTFLTEAVRARTPLLLMTGDTPLEPTHFQRLDLATVAGSVGAGYERVYSPGTLVRDLGRALRRAASERRPVVLDLPIWMVRKEAGEQPSMSPLPAPARPGADADALEEAVALVLAAKHPVVLGGAGAVRSGAREALVALADALGAPLATTALGKELFSGHPANLSIFGNLAHSVASQTIGEADLVLAFGASLNTYTSVNGDLTRGKRVVQVDVDPAAFGWFTPVDVAMIGDARTVAEQMTTLIDEVGHRPATGWREGIERALVTHDPRSDYRDRTDSVSDTVDVRTAMLTLDPLLPERQVVSDIGRFVVGVWPYLRVREAGQFVSMGAFGSIGLGLAGAIGAAIARPDGLTVLAVGDGGYAMSLGELATAVREGLPLLILVLNDGAYGAEYYKLEHFGVDPAYSRLQSPDFVEVARAMGADGTTVRRLEDMETVGKVAQDLCGPYVVDLQLDAAVNVLDG